MPFPRVFDRKWLDFVTNSLRVVHYNIHAIHETTTSRIWTKILVSIYYYDNGYEKGQRVYVQICKFFQYRMYLASTHEQNITQGQFLIRV